jgi:hypothetical protein
MLISNFLIKTRSSIFTYALTSNSFNWTSPDYHMDQHQLSESSHGARTQDFYQLSSISLFVYEIPFHTHTHTHTHTHPHLCQKCWRPRTNAWMINQIKPTHSPETLAVISKLK